jgi:hypothetical protein
MSDGLKAAAALAVTLAIAAAVLAACYLGSWWIFADSTRRQGEIRRDTFEFQQGRVDGAMNQVADVRAIDVQLTTPDLAPETAEGLRNQRAGIVRQACRSIGEVNGAIPSDLTTFQAQECTNR